MVCLPSNRAESDPLRFPKTCPACEKRRPTLAEEARPYRGFDTAGQGRWPYAICPPLNQSEDESCQVKTNGPPGFYAETFTREDPYPKWQEIESSYKALTTQAEHYAFCMSYFLATIEGESGATAQAKIDTGPAATSPLRNSFQAGRKFLPFADLVAGLSFRLRFSQKRRRRSTCGII